MTPSPMLPKMPIEQLIKIVQELESKRSMEQPVNPSLQMPQGFPPMEGLLGGSEPELRKRLEQRVKELLGRGLLVP